MRTRFLIIPVLLMALFLTACSEANGGDGLDSETVSDTIGQRVQNLVQEAGLDETQILGL